MSGVELWLVRHGETEWNASGRWQGHADVELSAVGIEQAARLAARLAGETFAAAYSSDLRRASETARAVAASLSPTLPVMHDVRLREIDVGAMSGLSTAEGLERGINVHSIAYDEGWPQGESRADLLARVRQALDDIIARHEEGRVLVFGHGGTIGAAIMALLGIEHDHYHALFGRIGNTSVSRLATAHGRWRVNAFNDTAHVEAAWNFAPQVRADAPAPELDSVP